MNYFVVAISYPRTATRPAEVEAVVNPEITRREVVSRIRSGEYERERILFIHEVNDFGDGHMIVSDVKDELISEAEALAFADDFEAVRIDRRAADWDHARDLRKHSEAAE